MNLHKVTQSSASILNKPTFAQTSYSAEPCEVGRVCKPIVVVCKMRPQAFQSFVGNAINVRWGWNSNSEPQASWAVASLPLPSYCDSAHILSVYPICSITVFRIQLNPQAYHLARTIIICFLDCCRCFQINLPATAFSLLQSVLITVLKYVKTYHVILLHKISKCFPSYLE